MNYIIRLNDRDGIDEAIERVRYYGVWYVMTVAKEWELMMVHGLCAKMRYEDLGVSLTCQGSTRWIVFPLIMERSLMNYIKINDINAVTVT